MLNRVTLREKLFRKFSTTQILVMSFVMIIFLGSLLLCLPISNQLPALSYLDNLFLATSAVCVTGLTPVVVAEQFSFFGKTLFIIMMQIGGLGLMSFLAFFLTAARKKMKMAEKQLLVDSMSKEDMSSVPEYVARIMKYTAFFEILGIVLLAIVLIPDYGFGEGLFNAIFLSVSSFCNAGFDPIGAVSLEAYVSNPILNLTIMTLIVTGGLGFIVWFDFRDHWKSDHKKATKFRFHSLFHRLHLHTKIVLVSTGFLLVLGTVLFLLLEWNNPGTLGPLGVGSKFLASAFQSVTLRTAGFSTIRIGGCTKAMQLIMCLFMLIGGSPGGTAGGIKTTSFFLMIVLIHYSLRYQNESQHVFHRQIARTSFHRAFTVFALYCTALLGAVIILCITENPQIDFLSLVFEAFSAIGTVGLSTGITGSLSVIGKIVIMGLMFIGRVGPISLVLLLMRSKLKKTPTVSYPDEDVITG